MKARSFAALGFAVLGSLMLITTHQSPLSSRYVEPMVPSTEVPVEPIASIPVESKPSDVEPPKLDINAMSCNELAQRVHEGLKKPDKQASDHDITQIMHMARRAADLNQNPKTPCSERIFQEVRSTPSCGDMFHAVAAGLFASEMVASSRIADATSLASEECQIRMLRAAQHTTNVDMKLVKLVETIAKTATPEHERWMAGWLTLGSLQYIARKTNNHEASNYIDPILFDKLSGAKDYPRLVMLEAAANGACEKCVPLLEEAMKDSDWTFRRAAASAWRFHKTETSVERMCQVLLSDPKSDVREQTGWALRFLENFEEKRVGCLLAAATRDDTSEVRKVSLQSLSVLMSSMPSAVKALRHLTSEFFPLDIRRSAYEHLLTSGSQEAIAGLTPIEEPPVGDEQPEDDSPMPTPETSGSQTPAVPEFPKM